MVLSAVRFYDLRERKEMKYQKFVMVGAGLALSLALTACGGTPQQNTQSTTQTETKQETTP